MKAVVLIAFGCPDNLGNIGPFMGGIMGKTPPEPLVASVRRRYEKIGGKSPLTEITQNQARALKAELGGNFIVDFAYQYWVPEIPEVVSNLIEKGVEEIFFVPMSAFNSEVSTGTYQKTIQDLEAKYPEIKFFFRGGLGKQPLFIKAHQDILNNAVKNYSPKDTGIIFTAHSLPKKAIENGDPYLDEFLAAVKSIGSGTAFPWQYAFQSKGKSGGEWLGPDVEEVITVLLNQGTKNVIIDPVGFVADHIETLYDLDIELREKFSKVNIIRLPALNAHPFLLKALKQLVLKLEG